MATRIPSLMSPNRRIMRVVNGHHHRQCGLATRAMCGIMFSIGHVVDGLQCLGTAGWCHYVHRAAVGGGAGITGRSVRVAEPHPTHEARMAPCNTAALSAVAGMA